MGAASTLLGLVPGLGDWLSQYWVRVRGPDTLLLYPKQGGSLANNTLPGHTLANASLPRPTFPAATGAEVEAQGRNNTISDDLAGKQRTVLLLKKLLERRLKKGLDEVDGNFKPSQEIK